MHYVVQPVPTCSVTKLVTIIKSLPAREIFRCCPGVKKKLWGGEFWSDGYFASTVGRQGNERTIGPYVKQQGSTYRQQHEDRQLALFRLLRRLRRGSFICRWSFGQAVGDKPDPRQQWKKEMTVLARIIAATSALCLSTTAMAFAPSPVGANHGIVVTGQHIASRVGAEIMQQGGNAVDAAVAVGYALAVVYPAAGNIGGGGFMTIRLADGRTMFLDFREKAPLAATETCTRMPAATWCRACRRTAGWRSACRGRSPVSRRRCARYGTCPREKVMAPAIALARDGFELTSGDVALLREGTEALPQGSRGRGDLPEATASPMRRRPAGSSGSGERRWRRSARRRRTRSKRGRSAMPSSRRARPARRHHREGGFRRATRCAS